MDVVLNWLTQGVVVAIAAAAGLQLIPAPGARHRYRFTWAAYILVMMLPGAPLAMASLTALATMSALTASAAPVNLAPFSATRVTIPAVWWTSSEVAIALCLIWCSVQAARLALGGLAVHRAKRQSRECPDQWLAGLPHWSQVRSAGRHARVVLSDHVRFAAVLGCGSPIIALAPDLPLKLSAADLDRVLVHEWAHVQRRDDIAQLLQRLVRVIVGWHPAAWWLERQIEFEREAACDEIAVRVTGSAKAYATCLTTLASLPHAPVHALPGLAAVSTPQLRRRLVRILATRCVSSSRRARAAAVCGGGVLAVLALAVSHVRVVASTLPTPALAETAPPRATMVVAVAAAAQATRVVQPNPPSPSTPQRSGNSSAIAQLVATDHPRDNAIDNASLPAGDQSPAATQPGELLTSVAWPVATHALVPPAPSTEDSRVTTRSAKPTTAPAASQATDKGRTPWAAAADAGVAIGRTSQNASVATAGFFSRFGKAVARSF